MRTTFSLISDTTGQRAALADASSAASLLAVAESVSVVEIMCGFTRALVRPEGYRALLMNGENATSEVPADSWDGEEALHRLRTVTQEVTSAIKKSHGVRVADLVFVPPGSLPTTTSGKVRRSACVEQYRQDEFSRLDVTP
jgi:long-chain fatty acid adenylase/transferase FadD26